MSGSRQPSTLADYRDAVTELLRAGEPFGEIEDLIDRVEGPEPGPEGGVIVDVGDGSAPDKSPQAEPRPLRSGLNVIGEADARLRFEVVGAADRIRPQWRPKKKTVTSDPG